MIVRMTLLTDAVFGNGASVPGAEDISVLCDRNGFPYYKGSTFKGIFREELERLLEFRGTEAAAAREMITDLLGQAGDDEKNDGKIRFSDFCISNSTQKKVLSEIKNAGEVTDVTTNLRTFTAVDEDGSVKKGSLRMARCVDRGLSFYSRMECPPDEKELITETLGMIKWVGSMRNRGFGKVRISVITEAE